MSNKKKKSDETSSPTRSLTFTAELYPEWNNYINILAYIQKLKYAYIVHDKDTNENGEVKKIHSHVVIKYGGRRTLSSVKNEFKTIGVPSNLINTCNERAMLRYLIHLDDNDKYQYSKDDVKTNMIDECNSAWNDEISSEEAFLMLNKYISETKENITAIDMNMYAIRHGYLKGLKAYQSLLNNARIEHNQMYLKNNRVSDLVDREKVKEMVKENNKFNKLKKTADLFGSVTVEDEDGSQYVYYKKNQNESKNDVKNENDELDLFHGVDEYLNNRK